MLDQLSFKRTIKNIARTSKMQSKVTNSGNFWKNLAKFQALNRSHLTHCIPCTKSTRVSWSISQSLLRPQLQSSCENAHNQVLLQQTTFKWDGLAEARDTRSRRTSSRGAITADWRREGILEQTRHNASSYLITDYALEKAWMTPSKRHQN